MKTYAYLMSEENFAKLKELEKQLHNGTDRERDYGHRLWLVLKDVENYLTDTDKI